MGYYNELNKKNEYGILDYNFLEKDDNFNNSAANTYVEQYNKHFDLDKGLYNQRLIDKFLDNMEELNKKVIFIVPPATSFYRNSLSKDMINSYKQLVSPTINKHSCASIIDLFEEEQFNNSDFCDYDKLNVNGANKLSSVIAKEIKNNT